MACDLIEIVPLAFMRGRTLNDALIILDEAQNTTKGQMLMFLTRLGHDSKMVVTGDTSQIDLEDPRESGLVDAIRRLRRTRGVGMVGPGTGRYRAARSGPAGAQRLWSSARPAAAGRSGCLPPHLLTPRKRPPRRPISRPTGLHRPAWGRPGRTRQFPPSSRPWNVSTPTTTSLRKDRGKVCKDR